MNKEGELIPEHRAWHRKNGTYTFSHGLGVAIVGIGLLIALHIDTQLGAKDLLNNRMAYVAVSRGVYDAQIFTDDREKLGEALSRDVSHQSAHVPEFKLSHQTTDPTQSQQS